MGQQTLAALSAVLPCGRLWWGIALRPADRSCRELVPYGSGLGDWNRFSGPSGRPGWRAIWHHLHHQCAGMAWCSRYTRHNYTGYADTIGAARPRTHKTGMFSAAR
jgi:hypothetical protein